MYRVIELFLYVFLNLFHLTGLTSGQRSYGFVYPYCIRACVYRYGCMDVLYYCVGVCLSAYIGVCA